ncbi:cytochrome P450 [Stachybotrys elegans]|uniref:Cytochrome P450 n=1 Tax=Stachybotrys elegans TaxID=80388 RepID=A0A8K0SGF1_9HYPO|nr:cytochrome P450 [Stachybotrys elegans]
MPVHVAVRWHALFFDEERSGCIVAQTILPWIPYFGHVLGYIKHGDDYFSDLCDKTSLPTFNIGMASVNISLITPKMFKHLPKVHHLGLAPLVLEMFRRSLGLGKNSCDLLSEKDDHAKFFCKEVSRLFREELGPAQQVRKHALKIDEYICSHIAKGNDITAMDLEDWVFKCLVGSLGKALWGGEKGPFADDNFIKQLRIFLLNIQNLNNPVTLMIDKKVLHARQYVRQGFESFSFEEFRAAQGSGDQEDNLLDNVRQLCLQHGASTEGWTDYQMLLITGLAPNIMAASTWLMHHLLADPALQTSVREQLYRFVEASPDSIDLSQVSDACPLLAATWHEVLRFHGSFTLGRYVHQDTTLAGKYLLKKGTYALTPIRPHHRDARTWGPNPDEFHPERFLGSDGKINEARRRHLRVYGTFGLLCPGRFLAVHMAMALAVRMLLAFEYYALDGPHVIPQEAKDSVAGLATPAWDVKVGVRKPPINYDHVKFIFKAGLDTRIQE